MAELSLFVKARIEDAQRKLVALEKQIQGVAKAASEIKFELPDIEKIKRDMQTFAEYAKIAYSVIRVFPGKLSSTIQDLEDIFDVVLGIFQKVVGTVKTVTGVLQRGVIQSALDKVNETGLRVADTFSRLGFAIYGVREAVGVLKSTFGGFLADTIGRQIALEESILRTKTALVATTQVTKQGKVIRDPTEALAVLDRPVNDAIESIRERSLSIAGTTSEAIVQVFSTIATQVGGVGGSLKDAEDLAISFSAALGTLGMADPALAYQETRSILAGDITADSVLARTLGITNSDITKAKASAGGLIKYLQDKLAPFVAGQKEASENFAGITSNIQEIRQEILRAFGAPILDPILEFLNGVYTKTQLVFKNVQGIADGLGRIASEVVSTLNASVRNSNIAIGFDDRAQTEAFKKLEQQFANFAVAAQKQLDALRPSLRQLVDEVTKAAAMISGALIQIVKGVAMIKLDRLMLEFQQFLNVISSLNSTIIPMLSGILDLYGKFLQTDFASFITQFQVTATFLENVGVRPLLRLFVLIMVSWKATLVAVWRGIKGTAAFITSAVTNTINFIGNAIDGFGLFMHKTLNLMIDAIAAGIRKALAALQVAGRFVVSLLQDIALFIKAQFPELKGLVAVIDRITAALKKLSIVTKTVEKGVESVKVETKKSADQVLSTAEKIKKSFASIGESIKKNLVGALGAAFTNLKAMLWSALKFQATLWAIEAGITLITQAVTNYRNSADAQPESEKAAVAAERLATIYKTVGENASLAAKAIRDYNKSLVENQIAQVTKQIGETANDLQAQRERRSRFDETGNLGFLDNLKFTLLEDLPRSIAKGRTPFAFRFLDQNRETFRGALSANITDTRETQSRLSREAEFLRNRFSVFEEGQKAEQEREDVSVMMREREDIELAVKELRLQIEKEIKERRFEVEREVAQVGQQVREAQRQAERNELQRSLEAQTRGLEGVRAEVAQTLSQFQLGLFDAQTEAQRRQFEETEKRIKLDKSMSDYKVALEKQIADMRKRMNDFDKKVADYKEKKAQETRANDIKTALYIRSLKSEAFVLPSSISEVKNFRQAAFTENISANRALTLLKTPGLIENLGISVGQPNDQIMRRLKEVIPEAFQGSIEEFDALIQRLALTFGGVSMPGTGAYLRERARSDIEMQNDYQRTIPPVPELKGFGALTPDKYQAEFRKLEEQVLRAQAEYAALVADYNKAETFQAAAARLYDPSLYTGLPSLETLNDQLTASVDELRNFSAAVAEGTPTVSRLQAATTVFMQNTEKAVRGVFDTLLKPLNDRTGKDNERITNLLTHYVEGIRENPDNISKLMEIDIPRDLLRKELQANPESAQRLAQLLGIILEQAEVAYKTQLAPQVAKLTAIASNNFVKTSKELLFELQEQTREARRSILEDFAEFDIDNDPVKKRLLQIQPALRREQNRLRDARLAGDPEAAAASQEVIDGLTNSATSLGEFEKSLQQAGEALLYARQAAQTLVEGYKGLVKTALTGGDIKEAMTSMVSGFLDKLLDPILEKAFKPMQDVLEKQIREILNIKDPNTIIKEQNEKLASIQESLTKRLEDSNTALRTSIDNLNSTITQGPVVPEPATSTNGGGAITQIPMYADETAAAAAASASEAAKDLNKTLADTADNAKAAADETQGAGSKFKDAAAGLAGLAAGALAMFAGIEKMGEGGTQNTLLGLAGIFAGIGAVASPFGKGGAFAGLFRAEGGPVTANRPYIVGERGPELFMPGTNGTIIPNIRLPFQVAPGSGSSSDALGDSPEGGYTSNTLAPSGSPAGWATAGRLPFTKAGAAPGSYIPFSRESSSTSSLIERSNRETIEALASAGPLEVKVETQTINNVEYVTAEQHRKGMAQAASRGRELTLAALQNSVRSRRRVGLSS